MPRRFCVRARGCASHLTHAGYYNIIVEIKNEMISRFTETVKIFVLSIDMLGKHAGVGLQLILSSSLPRLARTHSIYASRARVRQTHRWSHFF